MLDAPDAGSSLGIRCGCLSCGTVIGPKHSHWWRSEKPYHKITLSLSRYLPTHPGRYATFIQFTYIGNTPI